MKKSDKGFVLAESIVVAVFVLGMFTYLALNIFPLISKYDKAINYDGPNEVYLANTLYDEISSTPNFCELASISMIYTPADFKGSPYYEELISEYSKVISMVIYKDSQKVNIAALNRGMREFFNYSKNKYTNKAKVKMLVEFEGGRFASVEGDVCS